jgi:hypothetical protein
MPSFPPVIPSQGPQSYANLATAAAAATAASTSATSNAPMFSTHSAALSQSASTSASASITSFSSAPMPNNLPPVSMGPSVSVSFFIFIYM